MAIAHPETFVKYHRGLKELLFTIEEPKEWYDTKVYIFWGLQERQIQKSKTNGS